MRVTDAQGARGEKEQEQDDADKPSDVLTNAGTCSVPGGHWFSDDNITHQSYVGNRHDELYSNMFLAAGGFTYQWENRGHILEHYHPRRPNAKADGTAVSSSERTGFQFPLPALQNCS